MRQILKIAVALWGIASSAAAELRASRHVELGIPVDIDMSDDEILDEGSYVISYNPRRHAPNWASWNLRTTDLGRLPRFGRFRRDPSLPAEYEPFGPDTRMRPGFDRGHLCPSADRSRDPAANEQTFLLTNVVAQAHRLNIGPWEELERQERAWARAGNAVYLVAGPVWDGSGRVEDAGAPVPVGVFKIVVLLNPPRRARELTREDRVYAVLMPNRNEGLSPYWRDYCTPIGQIEHATGYRFLTAIEDHASIEDRSCD